MITGMSEVNCYSRRILNPFQGTVQVVAIENGDAETSDGLNWVLYVNHEEIVSHTGLFEVRYGSWNVKNGLTLSVIRGTEQNEIIETVGGKLIEALERNAEKIPFESQDFHECWLLTEDGQPLALMDSVVSESDKYVFESPSWYPAASAFNEFESEYGDASRLRQLVSQRAGKKPKSAWYYRPAEKSRDSVDSAEVFPAMLLNPKWESYADEQLINDYLHWQAPWLLQLDSLSDEIREVFERSAWQRQILCAKQFALFPKVLDQRSLNSVRVQAQLMGSDANRQSVNEAFVDSGDKENYSP